MRRHVSRGCWGNCAATIEEMAMRTLREITSDAELIDEGDVQPLFTFDPEALHDDPLVDFLN
jgi:hypothetical protein